MTSIFLEYSIFYLRVLIWILSNWFLIFWFYSSFPLYLFIIDLLFYDYFSSPWLLTKIFCSCLKIYFIIIDLNSIWLFLSLSVNFDLNFILTFDWWFLNYDFLHKFSTFLYSYIKRLNCTFKSKFYTTLHSWFLLLTWISLVLIFSGAFNNIFTKIKILHYRQ